MQGSSSPCSTTTAARQTQPSFEWSKVMLLRAAACRLCSESSERKPAQAAADSRDTVGSLQGYSASPTPSHRQIGKPWELVVSTCNQSVGAAACLDDRTRKNCRPYFRAHIYDHRWWRRADPVLAFYRFLDQTPDRITTRAHTASLAIERDVTEPQRRFSHLSPGLLVIIPEPGISLLATTNDGSSIPLPTWSREGCICSISAEQPASHVPEQ